MAALVTGMAATALQAADGVRTPIPLTPADLPPEALFDTVAIADDFSGEALNWEALRNDQNARTTLSRGADEGPGGGACMRVDYEFTAEGELEYIQLNRQLEFPEPGVGIACRLKLDNPSMPIRLRISDRSGETHQFDMLAARTGEWQFVAVEFSGKSTSWGGDGNGRPDYPCRLSGICIDRPEKGFVGKGSVRLADVVTVKARTVPDTLRIETPDPRFGNVYEPGDVVAIRAIGDGQELRWKVTDFNGQAIAAGTGSAAGTDIAFEVRNPGYYLCRIEARGDGRLLEAGEFRCAAIPAGAAKARSGFVGVCSHFGQQNYPLESMDLMRRYGIRHFRDEIHWRACEREKGVFAVPDYAEAYIAHAAEIGMEPLIIFDYNNPFYDEDGFPNSPEALAGFARYATSLATALRGRVTDFEVWNEWIGGCGMGGRPGDHGPEAYGNLLRETYAAVKTAVPEATVVGVGGEYGRDCAANVATIARTAGPDAMDGFSIHPYRYPRTPEESDLVGEVLAITDSAVAAGAPRKVWITEIGYPTQRTAGGSDERAQARHCVRTLVLLQSTGVVERVYWYDFKDDGHKREYNEHNFGLIRHQAYHCAPKPAVVAMSTFIRLTGDAEFVRLERQGEQFVAFYRKPDGTDLLIVWNASGTSAVALSGTVSAVADLMGADLPITRDIQAGPAPVYITGSGLAARPE